LCVEIAVNATLIYLIALVIYSCSSLGWCKSSLSFNILNRTLGQFNLGLFLCCFIVRDLTEVDVEVTGQLCNLLWSKLLSRQGCWLLKGTRMNIVFTELITNV